MCRGVAGAPALVPSSANQITRAPLSRFLPLTHLGQASLTYIISLVIRFTTAVTRRDRLTCFVKIVTKCNEFCDYFVAKQKTKCISNIEQLSSHFNE